MQVMKLESTQDKSIDIIHTLTQSNAQLIRMTDDGIGEALFSTKKYMELIQHCAKIYEYLNMKNDKTWEEKESLALLLKLITGKEEGENTSEMA